MIARLSTDFKAKSRGPSSESWCQYTKQQQYNKRKSLVSSIQGVLTFCEEGLRHVLLNLRISIQESMKSLTWLPEHVLQLMHMHICSTKGDSVRSVLYTKDKFSVSNEAFHELSVVSNLLNSSQIRSLTCTLNDDFNIRSTPIGVVGVQRKPTGTHYGSTDSPYLTLSTKLLRGSKHNQNKIDR